MICPSLQPPKTILGKITLRVADSLTILDQRVNAQDAAFVAEHFLYICLGGDQNQLKKTRSFRKAK